MEKKENFIDASYQNIEPKRLVLCLDGTWNKADDKDISNIVRIRDLIEPKITTSHDSEYQQVYYHTGVGTGISKVNNFIDGATGRGLGRNIRSVYKFLSQHYREDLEIYIFGFSRGAFTARSLVAYIAASGLLKPEHCSPENEKRAWKYYRCDPDQRFPSEYEALRKISFDASKVRIRMLGLFDTVGSLGVPIEIFSSWNRKLFQFHNMALSTNVDFAFHALAIDEKRGPFQASLWQYPNHRYFQHAEQVWFPGVHSNIGGGYSSVGLSDRALFWMLSRIEKKNLGLKLVNGWEKRIKHLIEEPEESRSRLYWWSKIRPMIRTINQSPPSLGKLERVSSLPPHAKPLGEMLDYSVLALWNSNQNYRPENVRAALENTFTYPHPSRAKPRPIPIIDKFGNALNWIRIEEDRNRLISFLPTEFKSAFDDTVKFYAEHPDVDVSKYYTPYHGPDKSNW